MPLTDDQLREVYETVRPFTGTSEAAIRFNAERAVRAVEEEIPGDFIECGVQHGGSAFSLLVAQRLAFGGVMRKVHLVDSFQGLPPATERDGQHAIENQALYYADPTAQAFSANCAATRESVDAALASLGFAEPDFIVHQGWFADVLPVITPVITPLALVRLDGDWYDSTMVCLDHLMPITSPRATVILDDYYAWEGCTRAAHDWLSRHDLPYRIRSIINNENEWGSSKDGAYFIKATRDG